VERLIVDTWPRLITERGWQTATARALDVDRATICRDVDAILSNLGLSYFALRALVPTPFEQRLYARLGRPCWTVPQSKS
jgi:hypothetical protein